MKTRFLSGALSLLLGASIVTLTHTADEYTFKGGFPTSRAFS
jgi:hypothetical protein